MPRTALCAPLALSLAALGLAAFAQLRTEPKPPLTRAELRLCFTKEAEIQAEERALELRSQDSGQEASRLVAEASALTRDSAGGFKSREALAAHNKKAAALNARVVAHNNGSRQAQLARADLQMKTATYLGLCAGRQFSVEDGEAVRKEMDKPAAPATPAPAPANTPVPTAGPLSAPAGTPAGNPAPKAEPSG